MTQGLPHGIILAMTNSSYKFVRFTGDYYRGHDKIALNKHGAVRFSSGFLRETSLGEFKYVVLFYDSSQHNKAIAFKFTKQSEKGAFKLTKERSAATISALSFMKVNKLNLRSYLGWYDWKKLSIPEIGEVFVIDLNKK